MENLYRSIPTEIEALRWTGFNFDELVEFGADVEQNSEGLLLRAGKDGCQGLVPVPVGHWIVRVRGDTTDHWPVEGRYFEGKYERVS